MRPILQRCLLGAIILALAQSAHAQGSAVSVTTYVEVATNAIIPGAALLERYQQASRKQKGNLRFDTLQEIGRPNRFAIVEAWHDRAALDDHAKAESSLQFHTKLMVIETAPYDERINNILYAGRGNSVTGSRTVYVVTHVDVVPTGKDDCMAALKAMSVDTASDPGNISYEVFQQQNRGNHFTVIEAWVDRKSLNAHAMMAHTRSFREKLTPIAGALYDERFYKALE
jgi:quinol monooxygenase YgiN